jgi:hypothetical protein
MIRSFVILFLGLEANLATVQSGRIKRFVMLLRDGASFAVGGMIGLDPGVLLWIKKHVSYRVPWEQMSHKVVFARGVFGEIL